MKKNPLVAITAEQHQVHLSLAYASDQNFMGQAIYGKSLCFLHRTAEEKLKKAVELIQPLGLALKVYDAFRPLEAQQQLYQHFPDPDYVSHPETGLCAHCRGAAVDLTLVDSFGQELDMGTEFDDFRPLAHHGNDLVSVKAQKNRLLLAGVMSLAGFDSTPCEWWHYQLPNIETYPVYSEAELKTGLLG